MYSSHLNYLPLALPFFSFLAIALLVVVALVQVGVLRYADMRIGISPGAALLLLLASLFGSYINIPVAQLPERQIVSGEEVTFFGMHYMVPTVVEWPGTIIALNVGGAIIPALLSLYLLTKNRFWLQGVVAVACVGAVCYGLAHPVRGVGIAEPVFVPPVAAAIAAMLLSRDRAAPLAYISGSLGTLIGADLMNLDKVQGLGAPIASIGGAGTFDGIFLTGILAALFAGLSGGAGRPDQEPKIVSQ